MTWPRGIPTNEVRMSQDETRAIRSWGTWFWMAVSQQTPKNISPE